MSRCGGVNCCFLFWPGPFVGILSQIKLLFGPLVIQLVWYILFMTREYPPLVTSTSVNNC